MHVATFLFDDPDFTKVLLRRLQGRTPFTCTILVDASHYVQRTSRHQRPRLLELQQDGAAVHLCHGFDADLIGDKRPASHPLQQSQGFLPMLALLATTNGCVVADLIGDKPPANHLL